MIPQVDLFSKWEMQNLLRMLNMVGVQNLGKLSLKEYVIIPTIATENDQVITPEIIYNENLENQDTPELPPIHIEEPTITM